MVSRVIFDPLSFPLPFGAEDQDPPNPPKDDGGQQNPPATDDGKKPPESKDDGKQGDSDDEDDDPLSGLTAKELRRIIADNTKAAKDVETERDSLKKSVEDAARAQNTKEENLQSDLDKERETVATLRATNAKLAIISAIQAETKWSWHNPEIVAQQLDSKVVKVNDDGKVEGLKQELARVAKEHAYLLATNQQGGQGATGIQPGQGGSSSGPKTAADLAKDYPALVGRF